MADKSEVVFADKWVDGTQIEELWHACFGDDKAYVDFYMEHRMTEDNMLVIFLNDRLVSMASFLPVEYQMGEERIHARYVYAVATLPEYRGRGFAADILVFAQNFYKEPLILEPANDKLCIYYEKLGFKSAFHASDGQNEWIPAAKSCAEIKNDVSIEQQTDWYQQLRDARFCGDGYVRWDKEAISYALKENIYCGGELRFFYQENRRQPVDFLMYQKHEGKIDVVETTFFAENLDEVCKKLCDENHAEGYRNHSHLGMIWLPKMLKTYMPVQGYLNLTLG